MMKKLIVSAVTALVLVAGACKQETTTTATTTTDGTTTTTVQQTTHTMTPEQLGELGAQISNAPDNAQQLLSQHGLDEKSFEAEIRKVTENPDSAKQYAAAYKAAGGKEKS